MTPGTFVQSRDVRGAGLAGRLFEGLGDEPRHGVLVLHGAGGGGGYEQDYARLLAEHGYTAFCVEYFDAPGTPDALERVPVDHFGRAARWLTDLPTVEPGPVGVVGFSRGGEAALLAGAHIGAVGAVVAYVPSGYAFPAPTWMAGIDEEGPTWTVGGDPVPYVPIDETVEADPDGFDEAVNLEDDASSAAVERATPETLERATIPVERTDGPVLLVSGGEDDVWPSTDLAAVAADRLAARDHAWPHEHLAYPRAGHAIRVPYRRGQEQDPSDPHPLGGTRAANVHAAADAWHAALSCLRIGLEARDGGRSSTIR